MEMKVHDNSRAISVKELSLHSIPTNKIAMDLKPALCTSETSTMRLPGFCNTAPTTVHVHTSENYILNYAHKSPGSVLNIHQQKTLPESMTRGKTNLQPAPLLSHVL